MEPNNSHLIVVADDNEDDFLLTQHALKDSGVQLKWVRDGEELMHYLLGKNQRPSLILLDLNMPKIDGRKALAEIKRNPDLKRIPVVILTMSKTQDDVVNSYNLGANSFIRKPVNFDAFSQLLNKLNHYWFKVVELPPDYH